MTLSKKTGTVMLLGKLGICIFHFVGLPGSGKGTQCKKLSEKYHIKILSSGQILRDYTAREPEKYADVITAMNKGKYIDIKFDIKCVIWLELCERFCRDRMINRCRSDDAEDAISRRFEEFIRYGRPTLEKIKDEQIFYEVNASDEASIVHEKICAIVDKYMDKKPFIER